MTKMIPNPFAAEHEEAQFMDHYREIPGPAQHVAIVILFLAILAAIVILRDMLKTATESEEARHE